MGDEGLRQRKVNGNGLSPDVIHISEAGRERDAALDKHDEYVSQLIVSEFV